MSRSNNTQSTNPATRFFEWSGSEGKLKYYDKEKKENIFVDIPFTFLVLDQLSTVTGWSDDTQSGIWANEVRDLRNDDITVKTKMGVLARGPYQSIKGLNGVRFTKSIYIAYYDDKKKLQIGNLKAIGACLSAWIEYSRGRDVYKGAVVLKSAEPMKKGATKYFTPVFETNDKVTEATDKSAKALDEQLQEYLRDYFADQYVDHNNRVEEEYVPTEDSPFKSGSHISQIDDDEIPF